MPSTADLASNYHRAVHAASAAAVSGEEEAQLTTPVSNLFSGLVEIGGLGEVQLIRESRLDRTRPDFAVLHSRGTKRHQAGYIELKAPSVAVDTSLWGGRNLRQWELMRTEAEVLIVCNGKAAQIYQNGEPLGTSAKLPFDDPSAWDAAPLIQLLGRFLETRPLPITSVTDLSKRLAIRTADLRDRLLWLLKDASGAGDAARGGYASWKQHVHPDATHQKFADGVSQVIAYGMVLAALSGDEVDADHDGQITVAEARAALRNFSPVLAAAFAPLIDKAVLFDAVQVELGALETLISAINAKAVNKSADRRGEPWLYFYEDFLEVYDAEARRQSGVYYTPLDAVRAMVRISEHLLTERFKKRLGFADNGVVTLDPATGTGTFPLAVIDAAVARTESVRGRAGRPQAATTLANSLLAFELLPGPYSVAHLRLSQRLRDLAPMLDAPARVILTDTLESPLDPKEQLSLFGDAEVLAAEQNRAKRVKLDQRVTVIIGNPPYRRVERETEGRGSGGWVVEGQVPGRRSAKSLFDDVLDVAKKTTNFAHHASLYNLYVYFWRWAIWKAFEAHGDGPGVVSFITASSWLSGPGFVGLRQLVRTVCDEAWVIDLGGDNKGSDPEENIFSIETPVAIVTLVRDGPRRPSEPAQVHYRRVRGTASQKLAALAEIAASDAPLSGEWSTAPNGLTESFTPASKDADWRSMPPLKNIFPWQQPGCKFGRTWPIAPSGELLRRRWEKFVSAPRENKPTLFATAKAGRKATTKVSGLPRLIDAREGDAPQPIVRYGFRSFDRQWAFADPRMAKTESPSLWASHSDKQVFLTTLMTATLSEGPALTAICAVPDLHFFNGRGGKDIIPLYRDSLATQPNLTKGVAKLLSDRLGLPQPSGEDVAAYTYALLSSRAYQRRFAAPLSAPGIEGIRVPITADPVLWAEATRRGRRQLWLHTFAERFRDPKVGHGEQVPLVPGIGWDEPVTALPQTLDQVRYDSPSETLHVGDGKVVGVSRSVWEYAVSGMPVLRKWLGYRTAKGTGKAASSKSELDLVRPVAWVDEWNDELLDLIRVLQITVDEEPELEDLLQRICGGALIPVSDFPTPKASERVPPKASPLFDTTEPR